MKKLLDFSKHFVYLPLIFALCAINATAQTGAAGVGNNSTNVIWLDANSLNLPHGTPISSFTDVSGNGNNFTQIQSAKRPIVNTTAVNGLPALQYDGVDDVLNSGSIAALESANLTYFIVFQRAPLTLQHIIGSNYTSSDKKWLTYSNAPNNLVNSAHFSPTIKTTSLTDPGNTFTFTSSHITPTAISQRNKGVLMGTTLGAYTVPTGHNKVTLGNVSYTTWQNCTLNGYIAEVVIYNTALNNLERILIENYLGAKYNLPIPSDFYVYQATHNIGLVGIGNNGTNSQTSARGAGIVEISNPTAMSSNEYLLAAHTNVSLSSFTTSGMPASLPTHQRFARTWRVDETGEVGNSTITFHLAGGNNFGSSSSYVLLIDNSTQDGDFSDAQQVTGVYNASQQTISFSANLNDGDFFTLCGEDQLLEIHAINDGSWSNPNTWDCTCIPNANDDVYIDPGVDVTVDINAEAGYFSVEGPDGNLIMNSNVTLSIYADFDFGGTASITSGRIAMVGPNDQYFDAGGSTIVLHDFEINKPGGSTLTLYESSYVINGTVYPTLGNLVIDPTPGNLFIINSTSSSGGGRVAALSGGSTITGDVVVRRFIPSGVADWRDIAAPITNSNLLMLDNQTTISGLGFPDGCAYGTGGACFYSARTYTHPGYVNLTNITAPLTNGKGYQIFFGDDLNTFSGITLEYKGTLRDGNDYFVSVLNQWNLQGNPYASPINFTTITRSHVDNYYYIYDSNSGALEYFDGSDNSSSSPDLANGIIAVGQGFWTYNWGSLTYKESDKTSATANFVKSQSDEDISLYLTLSECASTYHSSMCIQENIVTEDGVDSLYDIRHFALGLQKAPSIAAFSGDDLIRKNYIKADSRNKSFDLYTKILNQGYHTIEAVNLENFTTYRKVLLFDNVTGEFIDLKKEIAYTFYSEVFEGHRFILVLTNEELVAGSSVQSLTTNSIEAETESMTITQMGNSFNVDVTENLNEDSQVKLVNVLGQTEVYSSTIRFVQGSNIITVPSDLKGVHVLIITTGDKMVTKKVVL